MLTAFLLVSVRAMACGPEFPNNLLDNDRAIFAAPVADFSRELARLKLAPPRFRAVDAAADYAGQTADCESADLRKALRRLEIPSAEANRIVAAHNLARASLLEFQLKLESWRHSGTLTWDDTGEHRNPPEGEPPRFPTLDLREGLPMEFRDYLEGAFVWHNPASEDKSLARSAWQRILERPPAERRFKSTWAAFMLGKSWQDTDPDQALAWFAKVRELAAEGFADSSGLAAASLGLQARVCLDQKRYGEAIDLYLAQMATGDASAPGSLRVVAGEIFKSKPKMTALVELAKQPKSRAVLTAYLISGQSYARWEDSRFSTTGSRALLWLAAVESAGVRDLDSAETLALAAYQANQMSIAERWIKRAGEKPVALWLQAKLLMRKGKVNEAAAILPRLTRVFPLDDPPSSPEEKPFSVSVPDGGLAATSAGRHVLGELGVLQLNRGEFVQAIDALLTAGFWADAAYVGERVLTLDELKAYVDRNWPADGMARGSRSNAAVVISRAAAPSAAAAAGQSAPPRDEAVAPGQEEGEPDSPTSPTVTARKIRFLLARRLTRSLRGSEAAPYYPAQYRASFQALAQTLQAGWDESLAPDARADALFSAAWIARTNGLELLGTELEPDWALYGGNFEPDPVAAARAETISRTNALRATRAEVQRASAPPADPDRRFHYRYQAAFLAWEAARLLPNNTDRTALILWQGGSWLKARDPQTADLFYKALVRRNRQTTLGAEADRRRWFPRLDGNGNIIPSKPPAVEPEEGSPDPPPVPSDEPAGVEPSLTPLPESETDAFYYIVRRGDTLNSIAAGFSALQIPVTAKSLREANPELRTDHLLIGQRIRIPGN